MDNAVAREILQLEHRGWRSLCDGTGAQFYANIMTQDAVMILAHGFALDRQAVIGSLEHAPPWDSYDITDPTIVALGKEQVILRYTGTGRRRGEPDFLALMGSVYVRVDGVWQLAHYQQTPVPAVDELS